MLIWNDDAEGQAAITLRIFLLQDMSEAEKRRNKEHKEINSEVKIKLV